MNFFLDAKQIGFWFDSARRVFAKRGAYSLRGNARHISRPARSNRSATRAKAPHSDASWSRGETRLAQIKRAARWRALKDVHPPA